MLHAVEETISILLPFVNMFTVMIFSCFGVMRRCFPLRMYSKATLLIHFCSALPSVSHGNKLSS